MRQHPRGKRSRESGKEIDNLAARQPVEIRRRQFRIQRRPGGFDRLRRKARFMGVFGSLELNNAALSFTYLVSAALVRNVRPTDLTRNTGASRLRRL
jgi:hypothetical protein